MEEWKHIKQVDTALVLSPIAYILSFFVGVYFQLTIILYLAAPLLLIIWIRCMLVIVRLKCPNCKNTFYVKEGIIPYDTRYPRSTCRHCGIKKGVTLEKS